MNLNVLIAEDQDGDYQYVVEPCNQIALDLGYNQKDISFNRTKSIQETKEKLQSTNFDVVIFDIGLEDGKLPVDEVNGFFKHDSLRESKIIIHTGNLDYWRDSQLMLTAIANGVKAISKKGVNGIFSIEHSFTRVLTELRNEMIWANIGRFSPTWKRNLFNNVEIWKQLKAGKRVDKIFLLVDISYSTDFIQAQREKHLDDLTILELFKSFANESSNIIENDRYKGIIERFSGDEFLAYFDTESNESQNYKNVIAAAIDISKKFNNKFKELSLKYKYKSVELKDSKKIVIPYLRILIHCGDVLWLLQGADSRPQLSIMTGNVASLYRAFTHKNNGKRVIRPNEIYISNAMYLKLEKSETLNFGKIIKLKGLRNFDEFEIYKLKNK
jgi:hypothetical protein